MHTRGHRVVVGCFLLYHLVSSSLATLSPKWYNLVLNFRFLVFFEESGGARGSYCKCINKRNKKCSYKQAKRRGGRKRTAVGLRDNKGEKERPKDYKLELIHDSRRGISLALHMCKSKSASTAK
jgi:hypothetical protein